ncbi:MAG: exosortase/archaeosortase family protein, partial [Myxococcota bacterium]
YRNLFDFTPARSLDIEVETLLFNNTSSGPPIVFFLAAWLGYRRWPRLRALSPGGGSPLLAALWFGPCPLIFAWATYTGSADLLVVALMSNLTAAAVLIWGTPGLRVLWLPVAFLAFAIHAPAPLINEVLWKFQLWTAEYTGWMLNAMRLSAFVTGDQIIRPGQNFAIIETCSGLRSVESLTMLMVLMIDLFRRSGIHAAILVFLAPLAAFCVNGFRTVTIILNPHSEVLAIHTLQGIIVLMIGLLMLYAVDGWLERLLPKRVPAGTKRKTPSGTPSAGPSTRKRSATAPIVAVAMSAALVGVSELTPRWEPPGRTERPFPSSQIPVDIDGWTSTRIGLDRQFMGIVAFRAYVDRRYARGNDAVRLFAGVGGHEMPRSSPFSPKTALPGSGWWIEQTESIVLEPDERPVRLRVIRFGRGARRKLVFDWREGTDGFGDEVVRAATALDKSAWARSREGVSIRISTRLDDLSDTERRVAVARLRAFYRAFRPLFDQLGTPRGIEPSTEKIFPM